MAAALREEEKKMKGKLYTVYEAGGGKVCTIFASCITKATKRFITTLDQPAKYELMNRFHATVRYNNNHTISSDFVITEA